MFSAAEKRLMWVLFLVVGLGRWVPRPPPSWPGEALPVQEEAQTPTKAELLAALTAPIQLNQATATELQILPGVGPTTAARILARRDERGAFSDLEELLEIRGIGPKTLEKIAPHLSLGQSGAASFQSGSCGVDLTGK